VEDSRESGRSCVWISARELSSSANMLLRGLKRERRPCLGGGDSGDGEASDEAVGGT
jgi:hypothetical protein